MPKNDRIDKESWYVEIAKVVAMCSTYIMTEVNANRVSIDQYYMKIADVVSMRSTCLRHKFGCVIVKDDQIISTGYNGAVRHALHCLDVGCIRDRMNISSGTMMEICEAVHAEQNALLQAGRFAKKGTLYINGTPCKTCSKMIVNSRIKKVVVPTKDNYPDKNGISLLRKMDIDIVEIEYFK